MIASAIIAEVSQDLNDAVPGFEYVRWSKAQLESYYREAYATVSKSLRDPFIHQEVVKVQQGGGWQSACEHCTTILRLLYECDAAGRPLGPLVNVSDTDEAIWPGAFIAPCCMQRTLRRHYIMQSYRLSATDTTRFQVYPPVPPGMDKWVMVECYSDPDLFDMDADVPDHFVAAIKQWMLYRALSVDSENNPAIMQLANQHRDTHFELVKTLIAMRGKERDERHSVIRTVQDTPAK